MDLNPWPGLGHAGLKQAHVALVAASGALFAVRGAAVLAAQGWPLRRGWHGLSMLIDTALLAAGVALWARLALNPLQGSPWLGVKLALLVLYVALGSLALRRARSPRARAASYALALAVYGLMVGVALHHHPLGWAAGFLAR